jgi:preprotein translocase subunit SecE
MARDRKRAKERQRRAASKQQRQQSRQDRADTPAEEPRIDPDRTIPDLEHGSAGADIAKAAIAAGASNPEEVSQELDDEVGRHATGDIYEDEIVDDGYDSEEAEAAVEGADGVAAAKTATHPSKTRRAAAEKQSGNRLMTFLRNSWEELKRVQWPDRRQVAQATAVVLGFVIIIGAYLGAADYVFQKLVDAII